MQWQIRDSTKPARHFAKLSKKKNKKNHEMQENRKHKIVKAEFLFQIQNHCLRQPHCLQHALGKF